MGRHKAKTLTIKPAPGQPEVEISRHQAAIGYHRAHENMRSSVGDISGAVEHQKAAQPHQDAIARLRSEQR